MAQPILPVTAQSEINGLYVALYDVPATEPGFNYWLNVLETYDTSVTGAGSNISTADAQYLGIQMTTNSPVVNGTTYFATLYPSSITDVQYVEALYQNTAGFQGTGGGIQYWVSQLQDLETHGYTVIQAREGIAGEFVQGFLQNNLSLGAAYWSLDTADYNSLVAGQQELLNKIDVSEYWAVNSAADSGLLNYTSVTSPAFAAGMGLINTITSNSASVTAAENAINEAISTDSLDPITALSTVPPVGVTYVLTTSPETINSTGSTDLVTGIIAYESYIYHTSTFTPGDILNMNGGTVQVIDLGGYYEGNVTTSPYNELAGITINGPFQFVVSEIGPTTGNFDFVTTQTVTKVTSLNSNQAVYFDNLPNGTEVIASGAAQTGDVYFSMLNPTAPVHVAVNGGVSGVTIENYPWSGTDYGTPTSAEIDSTGAANGFGSSGYDAFYLTYDASEHSITSLTINAATNLKAYLYYDDFNDSTGAAVTINGAASLVDLTPAAIDASYYFNSVNASGLTAGAVEVYGDPYLTTFTGGGGGGNELFFETGYPLSASATSIDGGGGTGNVISGQFVNISNAGIFSNWQILDVTDAGFAVGTPFDAAIMTNDVISGVELNGTLDTTDTTNENVLDLTSAATVLVTSGDSTADTDYAGLTLTHSGGSGTLAVTMDATSPTGNYNELASLTSTGDTSVSIASMQSSTPELGYNYLYQLAETDNHLGSVTISGNAWIELGSDTGVANTGDGVVTDTGLAAALSPTLIASSLTLIDASTNTGGVEIYAGANSTPSTDNTVTYTGLEIKGSAGTGYYEDYIANDANGGVIIEQNHAGDYAFLGGAAASATLGTGAGDYAYVGYSYLGSTETAGSALGDSVTFGAGATAGLVIYPGAEAGGTATTNSIGQTNLTGATAGTYIYLDEVTTSSTVYNATAAVGTATSLAQAENIAVADMGGPGVAYFNYGSNEYLVATASTETAVSSADAVVALVGITSHSMTNSAGIIHLA